MKVRELVKKFDEVSRRLEDALKSRAVLEERVDSLEKELASRPETPPPPPENVPSEEEWKKKEEELQGRVKVLEKHKAGLQDKCIALEDEWKKKNEDLQKRLKLLEKTKAGLQDKCIALDKDLKAAKKQLEDIGSKAGAS